jgi:hypothetical protein
LQFHIYLLLSYLFPVLLKHKITVLIAMRTTIWTQNNFRLIILLTLIWCTQVFVNGKKVCTTNFFTNRPFKIRADIALEYFLWGYMKDMLYSKKPKINHSKLWNPLTTYGEATRQQILFWDMQNCTYITVKVILNSNQPNITENLRSFISPNQNLFFLSMLYHNHIN